MGDNSFDQAGKPITLRQRYGPRHDRRDRTISGTIRPDESVQEAVTRLYRRLVGARRGYAIGTWQHFHSTGVYHAQLGYALAKGGPMTLDDLVVVQVG